MLYAPSAEYSTLRGDAQILKPSGEPRTRALGNWMIGGTLSVW